MNKQIMVVEDEGIVAKDIQYNLKSLGYTVSGIASSGEDALAKIHSSTPDLILMDVKLKGDIDGIDVSEKIRHSYDIPVVYLTAYVDNNTLARATKTMPYGYIIKPFEKQDLKSVIELALYRHNKEKEIQTWETISGRAFDKAPIGMALVDKNFKFVKSNASLIKLLSTSEEELSQLSFLSIIHSNSTKEIKHELKQLSIVENDTYTFEAAIGKQKKGAIISQITCTIICNDKGTPVYYLIMVEDITERKMIEEQFEKDKSRAEECNEHTLAFLANMSHEIKTPLSTIIGYSNLILNTDLNGERQEYIESIRESGNLLLSIINNILDQSKIDAGQIEIEHIPFSLKGIFDSLESNIKMLLSQKERDIAVRKVFPGNISPVIAGDPTRLQQVLNNLISNAIKFTSEGFIEFGVSKKDDDCLEFYVRDTGIGIPEDRHDVIFEPFKQAEISTTRKYGGTGLGLAITKKLVNLMGGEINIKSQTGQRHGSVFFFTHPYEPGEDIDFDDVHNHDVVASARRGTVLIVEDNLTNRKIATKIVEKLGYAVEWAKDGSEAISLYKSPENTIDLILLDIKMPVLDGLHVAQIIRQIEKKEKRERIPIVAVSAAAMQKERDRCLEVGCDYFMKKPVSFDHLRRALRGFLEKEPVLPEASKKNLKN